MEGLSEIEIAQNHINYYEKLYFEMNPSGLAEVPAAEAANFLRGSGLPIPTLSVIWEIADYRKQGSLNKKGAFIAFKLVAAVQQGRPTSIDLKMPLDLPRFPLIPPSARASPALSTVSSNLEWEISLAELAKYEAIFTSLGPVDGKLSGLAVKPVLLNSNLPQIQLARIWEMSDLDKDGMLDLSEFCIAMHLVYRCIETKILPNQLPPALIHSLRRGSVPAIGSRRTSSVTSPTSAPRIAPPPLTSNSRTSSISSLNRVETRSVGSLHSEYVMPRPGMRSIFDPSLTDFPVDRQLWEEDFNRLDLDHDGYVNGMDIRSVLLASGLSQQVLAHIWSLVDIVKTGRLNAEQFALTMELVKEAKISGTRLPEILPAHLIPPSMRASMPNMPLSQHEKQNPKLKELDEEIEKIINDRRKADMELAQLEADITIKNSAVKNLEIELNTLVATVKQLQNQKGEAQKRLSEMDEKIEAYKTTLDEGKKRLSYEEDRLNKTKNDVMQAKENANAEEQVLYSLREEIRNLDNEIYMKKNDVAKANSTITKISTEITEMDEKMEKNETETITILEKKKELQKDLDGLEKLESPDNNDPHLLKKFEELNLQGTQKASTSMHNFPADFDNVFGVSDPFKANSDPFGDDGGFDPFGNTKKTNGTHVFGSFDKDPFVQTDPFASSNVPVQTSNNFADFSHFSSFGNS